MTNKKGEKTMNEITISIDEYRRLLASFNDAYILRNLFEEKLKSKESIFSDEVKTVCTMLGIEVV